MGTPAAPETIVETTSPAGPRAGEAGGSRIESVRREPFRLFFPVGLLIAAAGVFPWLAFGRGWTLVWPGIPHSLAMTQGFLLAMAIGFLGTMIPRRTKPAMRT